MIFVVKFLCSWLFPPGCIVLLLLFTAFRLARKGRSKAWCPVLAAGLLLWGLSLRPVAGLLVLISIMLTLVAGIIPSVSASRKDPVVALRTE